MFLTEVNAHSLNWLLFRTPIEYVPRKVYHFVHCANYSFASRAYVDPGKCRRFVDPGWRGRVTIAAIGSSSSYTRHG